MIFIGYASLLWRLRGLIVDSPDVKDGNFRKRGRRREPVTGGSDLGDLLETLRTQHGWTLQVAAEKSGISHRILAKLEKGRLGTSVAHLEKYLQVFGFTLFAKRIDEPKSEVTSTSVQLDDKGLPKW